MLPESATATVPPCWCAGSPAVVPPAADPDEDPVEPHAAERSRTPAASTAAVANIDRDMTALLVGLTCLRRHVGTSVSSPGRGCDRNHNFDMSNFTRRG